MNASRPDERRPGPLHPGRIWSNGPLLLVVAMLCWAGSIVTGRAAAPLIPPAAFTALRWTGALILAVPFALPHLQRDATPLLQRWWLVALSGVLTVAAYNSLMYRGLHDTTAVNALLLQSATPLLVLVAGLLLFGERPRRVQVLAILVSLSGVALIAAEGSFAVLRTLRFNPGDLLVLVAVAAYALYSALLRLRPAVHPMSFLFAIILAGDVLLLPLAAAEYAWGARVVVTPLSLFSMAYASVAAGLIAYLCFNRGVELTGAARAGQFNHLIPVFGVLLAVVLLHEPLHPYHLFGIALIAAGLWLADRKAGPDFA